VREQTSTYLVDTYCWRRSDGRRLEVLRLSDTPGGLTAQSNVVDAGERSFSVEYEWVLDAAWRTRALRVRVVDEVVRHILVERTGDGTWRIDGHPRADLDGCEEIDLSITPFSNTLALRRFGPPPGGAGELTTLYLGFPSGPPVPSRQRYDRLDDRVFRYVDLGRFKGFEARLTVDEHGLVQMYEGLFERLESS
jgi:uncharacterized protein